MNIEWKEINPDYIVSSDGRVGSRKSGRMRFLKPAKDSDGYPFVKIYGASGNRIRPVHQLVAEAFLGPKPSQAHQVNHRNGIRSDNRDSNLEWVTNGQNQQHRHHVLKHGAARGEATGHAKVTEAEVREIRALAKGAEPQRAIGRKFGISQETVSLIVRRETWAWVV